MKLLFIYYCIWFKRLPKLTAVVLWDTFQQSQARPWFRRYYGSNIYTADKDWLLSTLLFLDFINDEGMEWLLDSVHYKLPDKEVYPRLREFSSRFVKDTARHHIQISDGCYGTVLGTDTYQILRGMFNRQLTAWLANITHWDEAFLSARIASYYKAD